MIEINAQPTGSTWTGRVRQAGEGAGHPDRHQPRRPQHRRAGALRVRRGRRPPRLADEGGRVQHPATEGGDEGAGAAEEPMRRLIRSSYCRYFGFASRYAFTRSVRVTASARNRTASTSRSSGSAQLKRRKPLPRRAEALAAQARHAPLVVRPFQQVHRQAVRRDAEPLADRPTRSGRRRRCPPASAPSRPSTLPQLVDEQLDLLRGTSPSPRRARRRRASSAAWPASCTIGGTHDSDVLIILPISSTIRGGTDRVAEPPAAHAVRLAEGVRADALVHHARLGQDRSVLALPDHVAVRLVAEDARRPCRGPGRRSPSRSSSVATPPVGLCGELRKIAFGRSAVLRKSLDVVQVRAECVLLRGAVRRRARRPAGGRCSARRSGTAA